MFRVKIVTIAIVVAALLFGFAIPAAAVSPSCSVNWGSTPKTAAALSQAPIDQVRAGSHACYDRLVFNIAGKAGGYSVEYVSTVLSEGQGAPLNVPGGARLSVNIHDGVTTPWVVNRAVVNVNGFRTLRSVIFGGSFEGHSQFGVGVRARLPFRVFVLPGRGNDSRIVLDIAHHW